MGYEKKWLEVEVLDVKRESAKALLVIVGNDEHWIPKSQIADDSEVKAEGESGLIKISEWIAGEKGLKAFDPDTADEAPEPAAQLIDDIPF